MGSLEAHDVKTTRGQLQKARKDKSKEEDDEKRDEVCPLNIFDFEDDLFCKDGVKVDMQAIPEQNDNVEIPVPALESIIGDRDKLITEQKEDEMLAEVRKQADARKGGYS